MSCWSCQRCGSIGVIGGACPLGAAWPVPTVARDKPSTTAVNTASALAGRRRTNRYLRVGSIGNNTFLEESTDSWNKPAEPDPMGQPQIDHCAYAGSNTVNIRPSVGYTIRSHTGVASDK